MPPRPKGHSAVSAVSGPHGGQASIRKAYEALGVQHFYASHGSHYTNPHEAQIFAAVAQLLDAIPPAVWLGMHDLEPDVAADDDDQDDSDDEGCRNADKAYGLGGGWLGPAAAGGMAMAVGVPEVMPPVPLRVLDLACGSGEATAAITDWNQRHPLTAAAAPAAVTGFLPPGQHKGQQPHQGVQGRGQRRSQSTAATVPVLLPYDLHITACDPYTGAAYEQRTGRAALRWSFEDIADGCLADWEPADIQTAAAVVMPPPSSSSETAHSGGHSDSVDLVVPPPPILLSPPQRLSPGGPHFDLVVCSFALHLCDPSRLYGTCTALSLAARWLAVLAPHKRPVLGPDLGWRLVAVRRVERTHLRLYRSLRVAHPVVAETEPEAGLSAAGPAV
ncbi:hypothetical protein VOLCADRAFT_93240 [Volvox carteri f. nagariensis]|uniref:Methyltransferase domain-containing protein n=1 Tax=Volvox carteri f. nagariensis TaxID=3068 RepID=D8U1N2_VOLCA|nr:uncharacterized protein VOLCADRAFT_93240 [Volvox carteri f. nagariensis]EFJ46368.1 hypothetical protein VOLCADRAFT_93240 [Volvox carteri f. nagariensis]|eukprot:XP_002952521.1 hypothetical protein VOLCADRAFT_93240 [Volvox carteri f. nagariensis]